MIFQYIIDLIWMQVIETQYLLNLCIYILKPPRRNIPFPSSWYVTVNKNVFCQDLYTFLYV